MCKCVCKCIGVSINNSFPLSSLPITKKCRTGIGQSQIVVIFIQEMCVQHTMVNIVLYCQTLHVRHDQVIYSIIGIYPRKACLNYPDVY